jgi:hypothetical protein
LTGRQEWNRTSIRRLLTDRACLGEYQPMRGRGKNRVPDGDAIENYYPPIVSPATFHKAGACLSARKLGRVGRDSRLVNVFSGLLKDARNGKSYITGLRVERCGARHHVLLSAHKTQGAASFPFDIFEKAVLSRLKEISPRDLLPVTSAEDEVLGLSGELKAIEEELVALRASIDLKYDPELDDALRRKRIKKEKVAALLAQARVKVESPVAEAWGEAQTLLGLLDSAPDPDEARLRLRGVLRRVIESIWVLVVAKGRDRVAAVQIFFQDGVRHRSYLILHKPAKMNRSGGTPAAWWVKDFAAAVRPGSCDFRNPADVNDLEQALAGITPEDWENP